MQDTNHILKEWITNFLKSRDILKKEIIAIKEESDFINVKSKTNEINYYVFDTIPDDFLLDNHISIVAFNTKENFEWLKSKWNKLITYENLKLYFINPISSSEMKWIIAPHFHHKICNKETFKSGLKSLYNSVERLKVKDLKNLHL